MVESVDDLESSRSIQGYTYFPNFEMLNARIASSLNKIIQNSYFKNEVSGPNRGLVSSWKRDRLQDLRLISSHWSS